MSTAAVQIDAGGRSVHLSSPERVVLEATAATPAFTKLEVARYVVAVEDGIMRALRERPTALAALAEGCA